MLFYLKDPSHNDALLGTNTLSIEVCRGAEEEEWINCSGRPVIDKSGSEMNKISLSLKLTE